MSKFKIKISNKNNTKTFLADSTNNFDSLLELGNIKSNLKS